MARRSRCRGARDLRIRDADGRGAIVMATNRLHHQTILALRLPAVLKHYRRVPVKHSDYPALIPGNVSDHVDGFLITPASAGQ